MSTRPARREFRLSLAHVDRAINWQGALVLSQPPLEDAAHLTLRALAHCLLHEERLEPGSAVWGGDGPDLVARALDGSISLWARCGALDPDVVRHAVQHNRQAAVHVVFGARGDRDAFAAKVASWGRPPRGWERLTSWTFDDEVVAALAAIPEPRQRWDVTIVGDHLYVEANGQAIDGPIGRG
jgi:uncharacterized protein YaeQ